MNQNMERFSARVTARKLNRRKMVVRVVLVIFLISFSILAIGYGLSLFVNKVGNFTVLVPNGSGALALSETADFDERTSVIEADVLPSMDNITKDWLPEELDSEDGCHNGANYIAQTFYLKNVSDENVDYLAEINIHSVTLGADEAIRVMIIKNGEETVYAKARTDDGKSEPGTVKFSAKTKVMSQTTESFEPDAVDKYTVVIWLEGEDPECVDDILGGVVKMSMSFSVTDDTAFT